MVFPFLYLGGNPDELHFLYHKGNAKAYFRLEIELIALIALFCLFQLDSIWEQFYKVPSSAKTV